MKIKAFQKVKKNTNGSHCMSLIFRTGIDKERKVEVELEKAAIAALENASKKPVIFDFGPFNCAYQEYLLKIEGIGGELSEEDVLRIKHFVFRKEKDLSKISREVEAFENFDKTQIAKRERIPDNVRLFIWQRDEGKCAKCSKNEKLEFDHIIPIAEGGSNTERNIQLLCENCNRSKGKNI